MAVTIAQRHYQSASMASRWHRDGHVAPRWGKRYDGKDEKRFRAPNEAGDMGVEPSSYEDTRQLNSSYMMHRSAAGSANRYTYAFKAAIATVLKKRIRTWLHLFSLYERAFDIVDFSYSSTCYNRHRHRHAVEVHEIRIGHRSVSQKWPPVQPYKSALLYSLAISQSSVLLMQWTHPIHYNASRTHPIHYETL